MRSTPDAGGAASDLIGSLLLALGLIVSTQIAHPSESSTWLADDKGCTYPKMTKAMASVLMLEKYKPAVCGGSPCQMQFPFRMNFHVELQYRNGAPRVSGELAGRHHAVMRKYRPATIFVLILDDQNPGAGFFVPLEGVAKIILLIGNDHSQHRSVSLA
jgi:hypothetical protein